MTTRTNRDFPRRGEVYDVNFEPVVGSEIGKRRPAIVVSNDLNNRFSNTVTVVPVTSAPARRDYPYEVRVPGGVAGMERDSRAKCNQIRTVDKRRVARFRGALAQDYQALLERAIKVHLAFS
jgi:mRNA interferase MazF